MKLSEFIELLTRYAERNEDFKVVIPVYRVGSVGGQSFVEVNTAYPGFDWDNGKFFIVPDVQLREIDRDEIKQLQAKYDELGWKQYKIDGLKRENKRLKDELEKLKKNA